MANYPGADLVSLLTRELARYAIFGQEALAKKQPQWEKEDRHIRSRENGIYQVIGAILCI